MRRIIPPRRAFTLMEVLVVVSIIAVILGLVFPALQSAREASRRCSCTNNLRQLLLALHNYEFTHRVLPPGVVDDRGPIPSQPQGLQIGWTVQLLPFIEQNAIFQSIDTDVPVYDEANLKAATTVLTFLSCPSDPQPGARNNNSGNSYAACHHDVEAPIDADNHGVFFLNSSLRLDDVTDGLAQTVFVGEKLFRPDDFGTWMSGTRASLRNTGTPLNASLPLPDPLFVGGFGSRHPGGANFGFGDGSIRFVSERINPSVYPLLGHRADGEMIDDNAFKP